MTRIGTNWLLYQKEIDCVVVDVCEGVPMTAFSCFSSTSQFNNMLLIVLFAYAERPAEQLLVNVLRLCSLSASGNTNNVDFGSILYSEKIILLCKKSTGLVSWRKHSPSLIRRLHEQGPMHGSHAADQHNN